MQRDDACAFPAITHNDTVLCMNDPKKEICNTFMATIGQMATYLQESGTIAVVRDMNHDILYRNAEFAKWNDSAPGHLTDLSGHAALHAPVHTLLCERENAVLANGKPMIFCDSIPFPDRSLSCSTVYFPVRNSTGEMVAIGMFGIPVKERTVLIAAKNDTETAADEENDPLTGIPNRLSIVSRFENEADMYERTGKAITVVLVNIDDFSRINEKWGRKTGDIVLVEFCELVKNHLRSSDRFGRWEDREFILVLPDTNVVIGSQIAERIRVAIENRIFHKAGAITASFGVASRGRRESIEECVSRADAAVYAAKMNGKNRVEIDRAGMTDLPLPNIKASNFLKLVWKREYECGNTLIDYQHRLMVSDANHLLSAILDNKPKKQITPLINKLLAHIQQHFDEEEGILEKIRYRETEEHALIHRQLIQKAVRLSVRFEENKLDFGEIFSFLANDVVIEHIIKTDKKYFSFLPEAQN